MKDGKQYSKKVHRLVTEAFIPNLDNKSDVNHINGCKIDNYVENLEWCTPKENIQHAYNNGLKSNSGYENAKLSEVQVNEIRLLKNKMKGTEIAKLYDVSKFAIYHILIIVLGLNKFYLANTIVTI
jgi:hypothetical protein